jgi:hypothetical protein
VVRRRRVDARAPRRRLDEHHVDVARARGVGGPRHGQDQVAVGGLAVDGDQVVRAHGET